MALQSPDTFSLASAVRWLCYDASSDTLLTHTHGGRYLRLVINNIVVRASLETWPIFQAYLLKAYMWHGMYGLIYTWVFFWRDGWKASSPHHGSKSESLSLARKWKSESMHQHIPHTNTISLLSWLQSSDISNEIQARHKCIPPTPPTSYPKAGGTRLE